MTIYLPSTNYACIVVQDANTIRAYSSMPQYNQSVGYTDFYINSHYIYKTGSQQFGNYSTLPTCSNESFTTNVFYRNDIDGIMITFFILLLVCFLFPYKLISRAFGRWLKI